MSEFFTNFFLGQVWWHRAIIPAIQEAAGELWFEASLGKKLATPHLNQQDYFCNPRRGLTQVLAHLHSKLKALS
jgi:hypothetical protein